MSAANETSTGLESGCRTPTTRLRRWAAPLLLVLSLFLPAVAVHAAIGTPTSIGSVSSTTTGTTLVITATAAVPVGNTVIVTFTMKGSNLGTPSCADSKGNTYTVDIDSASATMRTIICSATVTTAITTSPATTITVTHQSVQRRLGQAFQVAGIAAARFDKSKAATGSGTVASSGNLASATTQASELLIGSFGIDTSSPNFLAGAGYTTVGTPFATGGTGNDIGHGAEYQIVSATGTYLANATVNNSSVAWSAGLATYKGFVCGNNVVETGEGCDLGAQNGAAGSCCSATCSFVAVGTSCRASAGVCDPAETCTGAAATCPVDAKQPNGTACTSDGNVCTLDQCDGSSVTCQHPVGNAGTECRASGGDCDPHELCTGLSATCPTDAKSPNGTSCTSDGNACTLDQCDGSNVTCQHPAGNAGAVCRTSAGLCDPAETCTGASATCPADSKSPNGTECRAASGDCDIAEACDGATASCPSNLFKPNGTACSPDADPCTADLCDNSGTCTHNSADSDLDGVCDLTDNCPTVSNAGQLDTDLDNIGDACECLNVTCAPLECHDPGVCDSTTGNCNYAAQPDGTSCNDGDPCSTDDVCTASVCHGIGGCGDAHVRLPAASVAGQGMDVVVPMTIDPATGVTAMSIAVSYDPNALTPTGVYRTAFTNGMTMVPNLAVPGSAGFTLSGPTPLAGTGQVAWMVFRAVGAPGSSSSLTVTQHVLNAGGIPSVVHNGVVNVVSRDVAFAMSDTANGAPGWTVDVPINVNPTDTLDTLSTTVRFNPNVVQATAVSTTTPTAGWTLSSDLTTPGTAIVSMSGSALSGGAQDVATITFNVTGGSGDTTPLDVATGAANPGLTVHLDDGLFRVCPDADGDGYTTCGGDCNDAVASIHPGATELCDGIDQNCDGSLNDGNATASCNDSNVCTDDSCSAAGVCVHANNTVSCNDSDACTQSDTCQAGVCTGSNPVVCTASDPCHNVGVCNTATGVCSNPAKVNGSVCSDGNGCTQTDTCETGVCIGSNPVVCTPSDQCHVAGVCDTATGSCSNPAKADGAACSDGNACTQSDTCQSGACAGSNPVTCTASDQCHVAGVCDTATGLCSNPAKPNDTACNDGNACTQTDTCQTGTCTGSNPVTCTASDQCHDAGVCDTATGVCSDPEKANGAACNDGNGCTQTDTCKDGLCSGTDPVACTASDPCHDAGVCDAATGVCSNPPKADDTACNDGNACTQTDACKAGVCTGANPVTCTASNPCHDAGVCDTATGVCSNPSKADGTACNDGDACTQSDTCQAGTCTGANPVTCTASDQCHDVGVCDTTTGVCPNPLKANGSACDDGNGCTQSDACQAGVCTGSNPVVCAASDQCHVAGVCDTATGACSNPAKTDGASCDDGSACTQGDACQAGICTGASSVTCTASDSCHDAGVCDPATGVCSNPAKTNGSACNDGDACTSGDTCTDGVCVGGSAADCNDGNTCTDDACDPATGCVHTNNTAACEDGDACTTNDTCAAGTCLGGPARDCDDGNGCTDDSCASATGCIHANNTSACDDGSACTTGDACANGACIGGAAPNCDDGNGCTDDACDPSTGCTHTNNTAACDDGLFCTVNDACSGGACFGAARVCNAAGACISGSCDENTDQCVYQATGNCSVSGAVRYYRDGTGAGTEPSTKPVPSVGIDSTGDVNPDAISDANGLYAFGGLTGDVTVRTVPKLGAPGAADHNGAVTSFDAMLIARYSVQLTALSGQQLLAGDASGNGVVTSYDAALVSQFAASTLNHLPVAIAKGSDWQFLRCDGYPVCTDPVYAFTPLTGPQQADFYAILFGDVSGNWQSLTATAARATASPAEIAAIRNDRAAAARLAGTSAVPRVRTTAAASLYVESDTAPAGRSMQRTFYVSADDAIGIQGLDLTLEYDRSRVSIVDVQAVDQAAGCSTIWHDRPGSLQIAFFGYAPLDGGGKLVRITVQSTGRGPIVPPKLDRAEANEGSIPTRILPVPSTLPPRVKAADPGL